MSISTKSKKRNSFLNALVLDPLIYNDFFEPLSGILTYQPLEILLK